MINIMGNVSIFRHGIDSIFSLIVFFFYIYYCAPFCWVGTIINNFQDYETNYNKKKGEKNCSNVER